MSLLRKLPASALGGSAVLALALMSGRITGLIREMVLASRFGVSADADAAIILLAIPDLLINLLLSGGFSAALVPRFRQLSAVDAARLFWEVCAWVALACMALALPILIWPEVIFGVFAPGASDPVQLAGRNTMALVALSVPLTALTGVTGALLAAHERYFAAGIGTFILNSTVIGVLTVGGMPQGLAALGFAILVGTALRLASQLLVLPHGTWRWKGGERFIDTALLTSFAAGVAASALAVASAPLVRAAASLLGSGNIATFNYAQKLVELPIGVLITTIGTVSLSRLSGYFAAGNHDLARLSLFTDLRLALALGLLVVAFGIGLAEPLVSLIFFRGAVSADQVEDIVTLTRIALLGVPFIAVSSLATSTLNAQLRAKEVMRSAFLSIIALLVLIAPGLVLVSETLLMSSVVGSQAVLAWLLARRADICLWGSAGVINHQFLRAATLALLLSAASIMIILSYNQSGIFLLLGLSIIGFTISVVAFLLTTRN